MSETKRSCRKLVQEFPLRRIRTEKQYQAVQDRIDVLLDRGELTQEEQEYLTMLGMLVEAYEASIEDEEDYELRGVELVKSLLEEHGLRQKDLVDIFKTESIVSAVLNGHRSLTVEHIDKLAQSFNLPPELFFPREQLKGRRSRYSTAG